MWHKCLTATNVNILKKNESLRKHRSSTEYNGSKNWINQPRECFTVKVEKLINASGKSASNVLLLSEEVLYNRKYRRKCRFCTVRGPIELFISFVF